MRDLLLLAIHLLVTLAKLLRPGGVRAVWNDRKCNPALFARLAAGDGFGLIQRCRALRRDACYAGAQPIGNAG
jgi:hypothetical protein